MQMTEVITESEVASSKLKEQTGSRSSEGLPTPQVPGSPHPYPVTWLPPARLHLLKVPRPSRTLTQLNMQTHDLWETICIQVMTVGFPHLLGGEEVDFMISRWWEKLLLSQTQLSHI